MGSRILLSYDSTGTQRVKGGYPGPGHVAGLNPENRWVAGLKVADLRGEDGVRWTGLIGVDGIIPTGGRP